MTDERGVEFTFTRLDATEVAWQDWGCGCREAVYRSPDGELKEVAETCERHAAILYGSRIPASDEAEEEESIMDVAREFAEAGATVHFLEGDGTVTDFEEEPR